MNTNTRATFDTEKKSEDATNIMATDIVKAEAVTSKAVAKAEAALKRALSIAKAKEEAIASKAKAKEEAIASKAKAKEEAIASKAKAKEEAVIKKAKDKAETKIAKDIALKEAAALEKIFKAKVKADKLGLYYKNTEISMDKGIFTVITSRKSLFKNGAFDAACAFSSYYLFDAFYQDFSYIAGTRITLPMIESILGIKGSDHILSDLIKENGIMDSIGLTRTTDEIPLFKSINEKGQLKFITTYDAKLSSPVLNSKYYSTQIKFPVRSFYKTFHSESKKILDGTYYDKEDTFKIPFQVIMYCLKNSEIGLMGFYLYSYLKSKYEGSGYLRIPSNITEETGFETEILRDYLEALVTKNMIFPSSISAFSSECEYAVLDFEDFMKPKKKA